MHLGRMRSIERLLCFCYIPDTVFIHPDMMTVILNEDFVSSIISGYESNEVVILYHIDATHRFLFCMIMWLKAYAFASGEINIL